MRSGFILPFLLLGLLALAVYYILVFTAVYPNEKTQNMARSIPKYATATSWQIINAKSPCLFNFNNCQTPPSKIVFQTVDSWPTIYKTYITNMGDFGWETNSRIVTSIPTSIVFVNKQNCNADLAEDKTVFKERNPEVQNYPHDYIFTIVCKN